MIKLRGLIFDVDGTLVDTEELHRQAFNQAFLKLRLGWTWDPDLYADLLRISGGPDRIASYIDRQDLPEPERRRLRELIGPIHRQKTAIYGEFLADQAVPLRPGIARLMEEAVQAGFTIGLAATSATENLKALVNAALPASLRASVSATVGGDLVTRKKPAPDLYRLVLSMIRVPAEAAIAVEDSANGLASARAAGLFTIVVPSRWTRGQKFMDADLLLPSLGDPEAPLDTASSARIGGAAFLDLAAIEALRSVRA